jgi:hypothetical protein
MSTSSRRLGATLLDPKIRSAVFFSTHNFFGLNGDASPADLPPATEIRAKDEHHRANDKCQFRECKPAQRTVCTQIKYGTTSGAGNFGASMVQPCKELGGKEGRGGSELLRVTPLAFLLSFSHLKSHSRIWSHVKASAL